MVIHKFGLNKSFQEILYIIDNWINEGQSSLNTLTFQLLDH